MQKTDFLYHRMCIPNANIKDIETILLKQGLKSHSTIGRRSESEDSDGNCTPIDYEHRIWFQKELVTGFDDFTKASKDCLLTRVHRDNLPPNTTVKQDDQFFGDKRVVFARNDNFFVIEPKNMDVMVSNARWKPLHNKKFVFDPPKTALDEMSPWIRKDFIANNLDPEEDRDIQAYVNSECFGTTIQEELDKLPLY